MQGEIKWQLAMRKKKVSENSYDISYIKPGSFTL